MKIRITEEKALFIVVGLNALTRAMTDEEWEIYQAAMAKLQDKAIRIVRDIKVATEYEATKG